jgi:stage III sporulation protein SpoIIIAA
MSDVPRVSSRANNRRDTRKNRANTRSEIRIPELVECSKLIEADVLILVRVMVPSVLVVLEIGEPDDCSVWERAYVLGSIIGCSQRLVDRDGTEDERCLKLRERLSEQDSMKSSYLVKPIYDGEHVEEFAFSSTDCPTV